VTDRPNVIKAVDDHAANDATAADAELDAMAAEFAAACLQYGELVGLQKFNRAVAKVRGEKEAKAEPVTHPKRQPVPEVVP
jgi:hypothetical protein